MASLFSIYIDKRFDFLAVIKVCVASWSQSSQ